MAKFAARWLALLLMSARFFSGHAEVQSPPIKDLTDVKPNSSVLAAASPDKPLILRSKTDAAKHFGEESLAKLTTQVGFAKQDFLGLPERMGKDPGVNPHLISITFGKQQRSIILRGGDMPRHRTRTTRDRPFNVWSLWCMCFNSIG